MKTYSRHDFTREERAARAKVAISAAFESKEQAFLDFVLSHYVRVGVQELDQEKLTPLLRLKYNNSIADAVAHLGKPEDIGRVFIGFQKSSAILEPATLIEDYRASNAAFRAATETANHAQQGDPNALGRLLVEIAAERKPPLHLPVGADAVQLVEQHHNSVLNDIKAWRAKSSNTAFNAG